MQVVPVAGGPVLVRGASEVLDEEGRTHAVERPVVALCACDLSQRKPWCDGTHKVAPGHGTTRTSADAPE
ncbi:hypothetical protein GCM10028772_22610 [Nocardioides ultimimeridianus]